MPLRSHPHIGIDGAVRAWRQIKRESKVIQATSVQEGSNSEAYILHVTGSAQTSLIAKRAINKNHFSEIYAYTKALPALGVGAAEYLGQHNNGDGTSWLFLEQVEGVKVENENLFHRKLISSWLGNLHSRGIDQESISWNSEHRQCFHSYHNDLYIGLGRLQQAMDENENLSNSQKSLISAISRQIQEVGGIFEKIASLEKSLPLTYVHGYFASKNLIIRAPNPGASLHLIAIDWASSGKCLPAIDLSQIRHDSVMIDLPAYCSAVKQGHPYCNLELVQNLGLIGDILHWIRGVRWESESLFSQWVEKPVESLRVYEKWMDEILQKKPWNIEGNLS